MTLAIKNQLQVWKVVGVLLPAVVLSLSARQADFDAAAEENAAAGRETLTQAPANVPSRGSPFITFDVPGAVNGTYPASFNPAGVITGYYNDANFLSHGFLRSSNGTFIRFDVPCAVNGTYPAGINSAGAIMGYYNDATLPGPRLPAGQRWHFHHV